VTKVAEAYFHLKPYPIDQEHINALGEVTSGLAREFALELFPSNAVIEVRLSAGSVKGWAGITVTTLMTTYNITANYKGFKESVPAIVEDAKEFGTKLVDEFISSNHIPPKKIYRRERRTKTPGKILRLLTRKEWLETHRSQLSPAQTSSEEASINNLMQQVLVDLDRPSVRSSKKF
jgi:hypothetical protein